MEIEVTLISEPSSEAMVIKYLFDQVMKLRKLTESYSKLELTADGMPSDNFSIENYSPETKTRLKMEGIDMNTYGLSTVHAPLGLGGPCQKAQGIDTVHIEGDEVSLKQLGFQLDKLGYPYQYVQPEELAYSSQDSQNN